MLSTVLILPAAHVDTGNAVADAMGWGPNNYSIPLSADGSEPATHWGLHAWATEGFREMIETKFYPPQVAAAGVSKTAFDAMLAVLIASFWPDYTDHFATIIAENGLAVVSPPETV